MGPRPFTTERYFWGYFFIIQFFLFFYNPTLHFFNIHFRSFRGGRAGILCSNCACNLILSQVACCTSGPEARECCLLWASGSCEAYWFWVCCLYWDMLSQPLGLVCIILSVHSYENFLLYIIGTKSVIPVFPVVSMLSIANSLALPKFPESPS